MVAGNVDSSVTLTFRVREQVTQSMSRIEASLNRVGAASANTGKFLAQNAAGFATAGLAMISVASSASRLAVQFGLLNEEQAKTLQTGLLIAGTLAGVAGAIGSVGQLLQQSGLAAKIGAITVANIAFISSLAAIVPLALAAGLAISSIVQSIRDPKNPLGADLLFGTSEDPNIAGRAIRGAGRPIRQALGTGEFEGNSSIVNVTISTFAATETELRQAAKTLGRIFQEESRIGGFQLP